MRNCKVCGNEIKRWQSYELDGLSASHMACLLGKTPAHTPGDRWKGDANLMIPKHKKQDGRKGNVPPHLRERSEDE